MIKLVQSLVVCVFLLGMVASVEAHEGFQDVLKEQYTLKSFSCKTCHPDGDDRKIRTPFAERIYQQMKAQGLSEKYAIAVKKDEEAKKSDPDSVTKDKGAVADFERAVAKDFKEAFKVVSKQTMTIDEIIKEGLFNGARLDTKALAAKAEAEAGK